MALFFLMINYLQVKTVASEIGEKPTNFLLCRHWFSCLLSQLEQQISLRSMIAMMSTLHPGQVCGNHWLTAGRELQQLVSLWPALLINGQAGAMPGVSAWGRRYHARNFVQLTYCRSFALLLTRVFSAQYGLDTSEFTYNPLESGRSPQAAAPVTEEKGRCTILWSRASRLRLVGLSLNRLWLPLFVRVWSYWNWCVGLCCLIL